MSPHRRFIRLAFLGVLLSVGAAPVEAQNINASGFQENRDYVSPTPFGPGLQATEHVDVVSGSLILTFQDLVLPGNGGHNLVFQRTYNSKGNFEFGGGPGLWTFGLAGIPLWVEDTWPQTPESNPVVLLADGSRVVAATILSAQDQAVRMTDRFWKYDRNLRRLWLPDGTVVQFDLGTTTVFDAFGNLVLTIAWNVQPVVVTQVLNPDPEHLQTRRVEMSFPTGCFMAQAGCMPTTMTYKVDPNDEGTWRTWTYTGGGTALTEVQPPVGPKWRYEYGGGITTITPHGGSVAYTINSIPFPWFEGQTISTNVVSSRTATDVRGGESGGTWTYNYEWNSPGEAKATTIIAPDGTRTRYDYGLVPGSTENNGAPWYPGRLYLVKQRKVWADGNEPACGDALECETREYQWIPIPHPSNVTLPEIASRTITRAGRTYTTTYGYSASNYGDFHQPNSIVENAGGGTGLLQRTRTRTFQHSPNAPYDSLYVVGVLTGETTSGGGDTFTSAWSRNATTGFVESETHNGVTLTYTPDARGNVASVTTATNKTTQFTYEWGVQKNTTTAEHTTSRTINADGTVASESQGGRTTAFSYDALRRVTSAVPPGGGNNVLTVYDNENGATVSRIRGPSTHVTTVDGFGRPIFDVDQIAGDADVRLATRYDGFARIKYQGYPFTGVADLGDELIYDGLSRLVRRKHPDNTSVDHTYGSGTMSVEDELDRNTVYTFNAFGHPDDVQVATLQDPAGTTWSYAHDVLGAVRSVSGAGNVRSWNYNNRHLLANETHPESGTTTYEYDNAGLLASQTSAAGTTEYSRDGNDRLTSINAGGRVTTFTYESGTDNRATMSVDGVQTTFRYDDGDRLDRRADTIDGLTFITNFGWDAADRLIDITYPSGRIVQYGRDALDRITTVSSPNGPTYATNFAYHPSGGVVAYSAGNGTTTTQSYDGNRYWVRSISSDPLQLTNVSYDNAGNIQSIVDARPGYSQSFSYDNLHRLTAANGPYGGLTYGHDAHGNLQSGAFTYTSNPFRLASVNGQSVGYDSAGRMTLGGTNTTYSYTPDHRMSAATVGGTSVTFRYDGDGWRSAKTVNGTTSYAVRAPDGLLLAERAIVQGQPTWRDYIYADGRLIAVEAPSGGGTPTCTFTDLSLQVGVTPVKGVHITDLRACINDHRLQRGLSTAAWTDSTITVGVTTVKAAHLTELRSALADVYTVAGLTPPTYTDPTLSVGSTSIKAVHITELRTAVLSLPPLVLTSQPRFYHLDHLGSVRAITSAAGVTLGRYDFDPFGNEVAPISTFRDPRLFASGERDAETGLDYFGARYHGATLGRFTAPDDPVFGDPFDAQSRNQYAYAYNNPLMFVDPTGHCADDPNVPVFCGGVTETEDLGLNSFLDWIGWLGNSATSLASSLMTQASQFVTSGVDDCKTGSSAGVQCKALVDAANEGSVLVGGMLAGVPGGSKGIHLGVRGLRHVMARHAIGGARTAGKSIFSKGENIAKLIRQASPAPRIAQGTRFARTIDAGRQIGIDVKTGKPTSLYTVITNAIDYVITAFPGKP